MDGWWNRIAATLHNFFWGADLLHADEFGIALPQFKI